MPTIEYIHHVPNHKIDREKWDEVILNSVNGRVYAHSIWLDNMSPGWNALILGDYEVVMPLTCKKKWWIKYLAQPAFTQQLGIFSKNDITKNIYISFFKKAQQLYKFAEIAFHLPEKYQGIDLPIISHKNYLLDFSVGYNHIQEKYSNDLSKKNLQRAKKFNLRYLATNDIENAIQIFKDLYLDRTPHVSEKNYNQLLNLAKKMLLKKQAFVREVRLPNNGELLACGLFFKDEKRIYNIASSTFPNGRTMEANHFLFDELIQEFAGSNMLLDFEGSDLPGVERFYKKFGPFLEPYFFVKWNRLPWPLKLLKQ